MSLHQKKQILALSNEAHALTERLYREDCAIRNEQGWPDKQRILLADMALHLLQTALREGDIDAGKLQNNLYSILTISATFLPEKNLGAYADAIIQP